MPQTVPSAGFTPPCDYSNFADSFDLSLLPGDEPFSPSTLFYPPVFGPPTDKPKTYADIAWKPSETDLDLGPDFHTLLVPEEGPQIYLEVGSPGAPPAALSPGSCGLLSPLGGYRHSGEASFYPSSPSASPSSACSSSPCGEEFLRYVKEEAHSPLPGFDSFGIKEEIEVKEEVSCLRRLLQDPPPEDHRALRRVLGDSSFQKRFDLRPNELEFLGSGVKMEGDGEGRADKQMDEEEEYLLRGCEEGIVQESIAPVLNLAIEQMREDVDSTCATLGISTDPSQWNSASVLSWIRWTSRQFGLPEPAADQWDMAGQTLVALSEEDFNRRASQGGMILHAQLEIWKAAYSDANLRMQWRPETTSSNASSGDISEDEEEETTPVSEASKPTTSSRSGTHIHLWQFLKELLASPQTHGSCIRWLDRSKGIFKIEDSVKVAKLWGKRKNRPAMNYDKLSRSIRQYYKKGIMKKTERSQRLVYQFCHPYSL